MPKNPSTSPLTVLTRLKQEAAKAIAVLEREIARREADLVSLRSELDRWQSVLPASPSGKSGSREQRVDWGETLRVLPVTFTSQDVQQKTGKPLAQVYAVLSRWVKDKKVRRVKSGGYQKESARPQSGQRSAKGAAVAPPKRRPQVELPATPPRLTKSTGESIITSLSLLPVILAGQTSSSSPMSDNGRVCRPRPSQSVAISTPRCWAC